jgi:hypothetical protein
VNNAGGSADCARKKKHDFLGGKLEGRGAFWPNGLKWRRKVAKQHKHTAILPSHSLIGFFSTKLIGRKKNGHGNWPKLGGKFGVNWIK